MKNKTSIHKADSGKVGKRKQFPQRRPSSFSRLSLSAFRNLFLGASIAACGAHLHAADADKSKAEESKAEEAKTELTPEQMFEGGAEPLNNWVELSYGAMLTTGSKGEAQQRRRLPDGSFGGIEDLHYQKQVNKETLFTLDGRALFNEEDYKLSLSLTREKLGYVRFHFQQYRTWYNGNGGFYRPADLWFKAADDTLGIDRGEVGFEAGLTLKGVPKITFEYLHQYRRGQKSSTSWGTVNLGFHTPDFSGTKGFYPSFYDIDEQRDIFKVDASHQIKATEVGAGVRLETGDIDNSRKMTLRTGEPNERRITNREGSQNNNFSAHAWSETWFKNKVLFSSGFLFANLDDNFSGSRIYGDDFDVNYSPTAANGAGYLDLDGILHKKEYVANLNLMATPVKNLTVVPSVRIQKQDWDAESTANPTTGNNPPGAAVRSFSDGDALDVQERFDVRYTGFTNWVLFARGEWNQGQGTKNETNGLGQSIWRQTDTERFFQKYSLGARWYPTRSLTLDAGGYYKKNSYDYDHEIDSTSNDDTSGNRYPAYLVMQNFETYDANFRVTLRPVRNVTLVSRYEYQLSTINTKPDTDSGLAEIESSDMTTHIFAQNISYVPWSRLSLQAGFNYVVSETKTGASEVREATGTRALLNAQNNYFTVNVNSTLVVDNKTDLNVGYFYYESNNYRDNSLDGLPLGAESSEHGVTALVTRRLTPNLRLKLRYAFFHSEDVPSGGNNDFDAHVLFTSVQYRF
ncbi:MAG: TonB-dependent receptor [Akkermansiaceae bacterium]|nr:TonB-dependent receptor [Verrucomicrobiales bacterium]